MYFSFGGTVYAYSKTLLTVVGVSIVVGGYTFGSWLLYNNILFAYGQNTLTSYDCANYQFNFGLAAGPSILYDSLMSVTLVTLFIRKLTLLVRTSIVENNQRASQMSDLMAIIVKFTVLLCVASITTWILSLALGVILPSAAVCIDGYINALCALYCFTFYQKLVEWLD